MAEIHSVSFAVGQIMGFGGMPAISALVFSPIDLDPSEIQSVVFCVHGGSYDKRYFHIEVPGSDDYSLCGYFADRGVIAITIDCLDTGESARAEEPESVTVRNLTEANHLAAVQLAERLKSGTLVPGLPPLPRIVITGIGHSLGGLLVTVQQSVHSSFDRVAVLGWSNLGLALDSNALRPIFDPTGKYVYGTPELRHSFHMPDVPEAVLVCPAECEISPISVALAAESADLESTRRAAATITVPVFVGVGEKDTSPSPQAETACFGSATDITFFQLNGSAHCHNFSNTRTILWDRLLTWMAA